MDAFLALPQDARLLTGLQSALNGRKKSPVFVHDSAGDASLELSPAPGQGLLPGPATGPSKLKHQGPRFFGARGQQTLAEADGIRKGKQQVGKDVMLGVLVAATYLKPVYYLTFPVLEMLIERVFCKG